MYPVIKSPEGYLEWFACFRWDIDASPSKRRLAVFRWEEAEVQAGESPWLVTVWDSWKRFAAAGHTDLWTWNGIRAKFIETAKWQALGG